MKNVFIIMLLLLINHAIGQKRNASAMLIPELKTSDIEKLEETFTKENYDIDRINYVKGYLKTKPKRIYDSPDYIVGLKIQIEGIIVDDGLIIYALYNYNAVRNTGCSRKYIGIARRVPYKKAGCRIAFDELNRISQIISPQLVYLKD